MNLSSNVTEVISLEHLVPANNVRRVLLVVQMTYSIPSIIMMVFFLVSLRKYPNSFYRLVQMDLLLNTFCYLNTWIAVRILPYQFGVLIYLRIGYYFPRFLAFCHDLVGFFLHVQAMSAISLSVHRITSVIFYQGYDRFWSKYYLLIFLSFITVPALSGLLMEGSNNYFYLQNGALIHVTNMPRVLVHLLLTAVACVIYFLLLFGLGSLAAYLVYKTVRDYQLSDQDVAKKLTKIAITYCFIFSGILFWVILVSVIVSDKDQVETDGVYAYREDIEMFVSDMMTLALPYILLIFDNNVRRDVFRQSVPINPAVASNSLTN